MTATQALDAFMAAMKAYGIEPLEPIAERLLAGATVRFRAAGDSPRRKNAEARLYLDGRPAGYFRHYKTNVRETWRADIPVRKATLEERRLWSERLKTEARNREAERTASQNEAAQQAATLWEAAGPADPRHPYLVRKGISAFGLRSSGDELLVPMTDVAGKLWNLQRLLPNGQKLYLKGGRINATFWQPEPPGHGGIAIGEGFATMAKVREATGLCAAAALSATNLESTAYAVRRWWPRKTILIFADDDSHLINHPQVMKNVGLDAAKEAARRIGAMLVTPRQPAPADEQGMDFADLDHAEIRRRLPA